MSESKIKPGEVCDQLDRLIDSYEGGDKRGLRDEILALVGPLIHSPDAIAAERERCAGIAEREAERCGRYRKGLSPKMKQIYRAKLSTAENIAEAIRSEQNQEAER